MGDMLRTGQEWLAAQAMAHVAQDVTYRRGATSAIVSATLGSSRLQVSDERGGTRIVRTDADFLVTPGDLEAGGIVLPPVRGDLIDRTIGDAVCTYEVLAPRGEPEWRYDGPHRTLLRIHTKLIRTE